MQSIAVQPRRFATIVLFLGIGLISARGQSGKSPMMTKADSHEGATPTAKQPEERKIKFNARNLPWPEVFQWLAKEIVNRHGGAIRVRSRTGSQRHGTVFTITLPLAGPMAQGSAA